MNLETASREDLLERARKIPLGAFDISNWQIQKRFHKVEVTGEPVRYRSSFIRGYSELPVQVIPPGRQSPRARDCAGEPNDNRNALTPGTSGGIR